MTTGIYKITNLINNQCYIGKSVNIEKRWNKHHTEPFNENSIAYEYPLYRAIRKYGIDNFSFKIIEECAVSELIERERYWISYYNSFFKGYNQTPGGEGGSGQVSKDQIIGIITDLENTQMLHREIAEKWHISTEMVQGINTGRYWKYDRSYPIQKPRELKYPKHNFCCDCGKEITNKAKRCSLCEAKHRANKNKLPVTREELKQLIRTTPFLQIGYKFGMSDNTIRKWCDKYNLPRRASDIKKYTDEEWEQI